MAAILALSGCSTATGWSFPRLPGLGNPAPEAMTPAEQNAAISDLNAAKAQNEAQAATGSTAPAAGTAPVEPVQQEQTTGSSAPQ